MNEELRLEEYPFTIRPLDPNDGGSYLIEFQDVPGCISDGETPEEAIANGPGRPQSLSPRTQGVSRLTGPAASWGRPPERVSF